MPTFDVKSPDGKTYRITGPEGSTLDDAIAYAQEQYGGKTAPESAPTASSGRLRLTRDPTLLDLPKPPGVVTDAAAETSRGVAQALQHLTGNSISDLPGYDPRTRGELGQAEGLMRTGRQIFGLPEMVYALGTGAIRSLLGHGMASAEHGVGTLIAPDIAAKDDPQKMYETGMRDVDLAMQAARPAGMPVKLAPNIPVQPSAPTPISAYGGQPGIPPNTPVQGRYEIPVSEPAYNWQPPPQPLPTVQELKDAAETNYQSPEVKSLELKPRPIRDFGIQAENALTNAGHSDQFAKGTFGILRNLQKVPQNSVVTGDNVNTLRKMFVRASQSSDASERAAANAVIDHLDSYLPQITQSDLIAGDLPGALAQLGEARGNWAAARRAENVDVKTERALARAATANSGRNAANNIRARMTDIYLDPKQMQGYSADERKLIRQIVYGTPTENAVRFAGNLMGGGGGLGAAVTGGIGAMTTPGGVGGLIPVGGYLLKSLSNRLTLRQADKLSELLRSRAPLASSAKKYEEAITAMRSNPAKSFSGVVLAARNLSHNLRDAGFNVAPSHLLSGLQQSTEDNEPRRN